MKEQPQSKSKKKPEFKANKPFPMVAISPGACELHGPNPNSTSWVKITSGNTTKYYDVGTHDKALALTQISANAWGQGNTSGDSLVMTGQSPEATEGQSWFTLAQIPTVTGSEVTFTGAGLGQSASVVFDTEETANYMRFFVERLKETGWSPLCEVGIGYVPVSGSPDRAPAEMGVMLRLALPAPGSPPQSPG